MALLGQGKKVEAAQAVQAAQQRAPASAKASLDKLALLATDGAAEQSKDAAPPPGVVFVRCTYVQTQLSDKSEVERAYTWRLERGNFQRWSEVHSEWSTNMCVAANMWEGSNLQEFTDLTHKCEVTDDRFQLASAHNTGPARISVTWSINRMTGRYQGEWAYKNGSYVSGDSSAGSCRPVKDPAPDQTRKF